MRKGLCRAVCRPFATPRASPPALLPRLPAWLGPRPQTLALQRSPGPRRPRPTCRLPYHRIIRPPPRRLRVFRTRCCTLMPPRCTMTGVACRRTGRPSRGLPHRAPAPPKRFPTAVSPAGPLKATPRTNSVTTSTHQMPWPLEAALQRPPLGPKAARTRHWVPIQPRTQTVP